MHYVKQFNINGVDTRQVACIESKGRPNAATEGCVGALCIDVTSPLHDVYKCVAVNGSIYTWELLSSGLSIVSSSVSGKGADEVQFNYSDLRTPLTYLLKGGDLILDSEGYLYQVSAINVTYCTAIYMGVNLVASTHTHPAEDIDRGILPYERGGTNADSLENAKDNLGITLIEEIIEELPISRGGTGAKTLASAKDNLGITAIEEILENVPISRGGTGGTTVQSAKDNLGIAYIEEILKTYVFLGTLGVAYELNGDTYVCKGIGTATDSNIIISPKVGGTNVTSIGEDAFRGCTSLKSIDIPNSVTSIGATAFGFCASLTSIEIPDSVTSIGHSVFYKCTSLASVEIGNSVTSISNWAFDGCTSLKSIEIPNTVTSIGYAAFSGCTSLKDIYVPWSPGGVKDAPWGADKATIHYNSEV